MIHGIAEKYPSELKKGVAHIMRFTINKDEADNFNMRQIFAGNGWMTRISAGDYVKLGINGQLMMSDTPFERRTNEDFIQNAKGHVMIAGLGIGLILEALKPKIASGEVKDIVVYEKYQDVIDLVGPLYDDMPLTIKCEDILTYRPPKGESYDTIYFDIWPDVGTDNLKDMALLHQRWKMRKSKGGWMNSWMRDYLVAERRREQRSSYYW